MNRTTVILAAIVLGLTVTAGPAAADDAPAVTDPWTGEVVDCFNEPWEIDPGVWECTSVTEAAEWGIDTPVEEPDDVTPEDTVDPGPEQADDPDPAEEPEPVEIVEDNGGWGWSDARDAYAL